MYSPCSYPAHGTRAPDGCVFISHYNIHSGHCSDLHQYRRVEKFYSEILQIIRVVEESKQTFQTGADVFFGPINGDVKLSMRRSVLRMLYVRIQSLHRLY